MTNVTKPTHNIIWAIVCLYLLPAFILSLYSMGDSWGILSLGLLLGAVGSLLMYALLRNFENVDPQIIEVPVPAPIPETHDEELEKLQAELNKKNEEMELFATYKAAAEEEIRKKEVLYDELQDTIAHQRDVLKNRQDQIAELEKKIHDLLDAVKIRETIPTPGTQPRKTPSIYQVTPPPMVVASPQEAELQLKRCIDIAGKITGANHFETANSRFKEWHIDNYALDLRRLFDNLRSESSSTIFVFAQKDNRLLFVNNQAKHLLGWTPEKFIQNFSEIIEESVQEWNRSISRLAAQPETATQLILKNKSGQNIAVNCHLAMLSTGIFKNHIIGVMYGKDIKDQKDVKDQKIYPSTSDN